MLRWVLALLVVLFVVRLVIGAVRGRVALRSCCAVDADRDLRLRGPQD